MANPYRNEVSVTLNGTEYLLRPTFTCLAEIEEQIGKTIFQFMAYFLANGIKAKDAYFILECGIKAAGGKVDKEELQRNMSEGGLNGVVSAIDSFLNAAVMAGDNIKKN